jgi:signal transduction histidine kinase
MGQSEALDLTLQTDPEEPGLPIGDLAQELLPPPEDERRGVVLVGRDAPRASEVIEEIDATLEAMKRIIDELLEVSRGLSGGLPVHAANGADEVPPKRFESQEEFK